ncbi:MAG: three-Cys-motif partner protein TcmP [Gemmatimonadaceae bacterium]
MSKRKGVLWPLDAHTLGKHLVLREYLKAWLPILGMNSRVVYIDAFSGPGEYLGGEVGSPLIALRTLLSHSALERLHDVRLQFLDSDPERVRHLRELVRSTFPVLPRSIRVEIECGHFHERIGHLLDEIEGDSGKRVPTLMLVDPFGVKGIPISLLGRVLRSGRGEVIVSFMSDFIERFGTTSEFAPHMDELFGSSEWRDCESDEEKYEALYEKRLRDEGAQFVLRFRVNSKGRHVYSLFYATTHPLGCRKMKDAMWKVAPDGTQRYESGLAADEALTLEFFHVPLEELQRDILRALRRDGSIDYGKLESFCESDRTICRVVDLNAVLNDLEKRGMIQVRSSDPRRRRRQFRGTTIHVPPDRS